VSAWVSSWLAQAFVLVLGALWLALLPISVLALVFGLCAGARTRPGSGRIGATLAVLTALLALSGAAVFATTPWRQVGPRSPPSTRDPAGSGKDSAARVPVRS
jgi:hypothetical protein